MRKYEDILRDLQTVRDKIKYGVTKKERRVIARQLTTLIAELADFEKQEVA